MNSQSPLMPLRYLTVMFFKINLPILWPSIKRKASIFKCLLLSWDSVVIFKKKPLFKLDDSEQKINKTKNKTKELLTMNTPKSSNYFPFFPLSDSWELNHWKQDSKIKYSWKKHHLTSILNGYKLQLPVYMLTSHLRQSNVWQQDTQTQ